MRPSIIILGFSLFITAQASWFSGSSDEPPYSSWSTTELRQWLDDHHVSLPSHTPSQTELRDLVAANWNSASAWTYDQYNSAQKTFADIRETSFDKWDESRLRQFLLEQGIVAPKGPKEQLVLLAKSRYKSYTDAANSFSSRASATASTMVYGDTTHQMSKSVSSLASQVTAAAAQATRDVGRVFDDSKDYVYSTWDDNQLRSYLENKGVIKKKSQKTRDELLAMMHDSYGKVANPVWNAWSDSYMHDWLVSHNVIRSDYEKNRDALTAQMNKYYYNVHDSVWSTWSESELKKWLVDHNVIKSDAQIKKDKMTKMVEDNYQSAKDTFWSAWSDNQLKEWLVEHDYMRSDTQVKRDQMIKIANDKYTDTAAKTAAYLTWPDARLRAYLRERGISEGMVPGNRPGLLQETRIRWVQTHTRAENLFASIKELVNSGVYKVEDVLNSILHMLGTGWEETKERTGQGYDNTKAAGQKHYQDTKHSGEKGYEYAQEKAQQARENAGERVKVGGEKIKGEL